MEYQLYINGEWKDTVTGYVAEDKNPADDSVFARVHFAGGAEVEEAIAAAQRAWRPWADTPAAQKEQILLKAADWMQEHMDEVADVLMGKAVLPLERRTLKLDLQWIYSERQPVSAGGYSARSSSRRRGNIHDPKTSPGVGCRDCSL